MIFQGFYVNVVNIQYNRFKSLKKSRTTVHKLIVKKKKLIKELKLNKNKNNHFYFE